MREKSNDTTAELGPADSVPSPLSTTISTLPVPNSGHQPSNAGQSRARVAGQITNWLVRSTLFELRAVVLAPGRQIVRLCIYGHLLWSLRILQRKYADAQASLGDWMYRTKVGGDDLRRKISALSDRLSALEAAHGDTRLLQTEQKGLKVRLAATAHDTSLPSENVDEVRASFAARRMLAEHELKLKQCRAQLVSLPVAEWTRTIAGIAGLMVLAWLGAACWRPHSQSVSSADRQPDMAIEQPPSGPTNSTIVASETVAADVPIPVVPEAIGLPDRTQDSPAPDERATHEQVESTVLDAIRRLEGRPLTATVAPHTPADGQLRGIDDGVERAFMTREMLCATLLTATVADLQSPGQGIVMTDNLSVLIFSKEQARRAIDQGNTDDLLGRAALQLALSHLLITATETERGRMDGVRLSPNEKQLFIQKYESLKRRMANHCKQNYRWIISQAGGRPANPY